MESKTSKASADIASNIDSLAAASPATWSTFQYNTKPGEDYSQEPHTYVPPKEQERQHKHSLLPPMFLQIPLEHQHFPAHQSHSHSEH
jgi:hypothetical protein